MKLNAGSSVIGRQLGTVSGATVAIPDPDGLVHLQFRRFAGCPVCNLHLRSFVRRSDEVLDARIREVVVFHSPAEDLLPQVADLPFAVVPDPGKKLYREFGVESAKRALLDSRAWPAIVRGVLVSLWGIVRRRHPAPPSSAHGGRLGLPADFLIASDGSVIAVKYGQHAYDQWSVGELLALARPERQAGEPAGTKPAGGGSAT